jgi:hypothetical protein
MNKLKIHLQVKVHLLAKGLQVSKDFRTNLNNKEVALKVIKAIFLKSLKECLEEILDKEDKFKPKVQIYQ